MINVYILFPNNNDVTFDFDYYCNQHASLVTKLLGEALKGISVDAGLAGGAPDQPAPFVAISKLSFESLQSFQTSFGPNAEVIKADLANFTNTVPTLQISEQKR